MIKKILLLLCIPTFLSAMNTPNPGLNLAYITECFPNAFPLEQLWGQNRRPIKDNIITINTELAEHTPCNIYIYPFKQQLINSVYLEGLPTSNLIQAINNVSKGMLPGAVIEIELHPDLKIPCDTTKRSTNNWPLFNNVEKNPFTADIDLNVFFTAFDILINGIERAKKHKADLYLEVSSTFMNHAAKLSETMEGLLTFYEQQGVGKKQLLKHHLLKEILILQSFAEESKIIFLYNGPQSGPENFLHEENTNRNIPIQPNTQQYIDDLFLQNGGIMDDGRHGYTKKMFVQRSLANFLLCDAFVSLNQDAMKNFMLENDFSSPAIERKTSSLSGRNNVWVISAFKASSNK